MSFKFENLKIWKNALNLSGDISEMVKTFLKDELFILTSQIKRAADSVLLNITEGSTLHTHAEFRRFLIMENCSGSEVIACLYLARQRGYITEAMFADKCEKYEKLIIMIQALIKSLHE